MANRDFRIDRLIVDFISGALGYIGISTLLKYDSDKDFSDPLSIPNVGYVQSLIGGGGSGVIHRSFTIPESDIVDGVVSLVGRTNDQGDQVIPSKATWAVETQDDSVARYSNATQTVDGLGSGGIEVYLVGVEGVLQLTFTNLVGVDMVVSLNSSAEQTLTTGDAITVFPGDSFVARVVSFAEGTGLGNQNGIIVNTDGGQLLEEVNHEWIIPIDSTSFEIYFI